MSTDPDHTPTVRYPVQDQSPTVRYPVQGTRPDAGYRGHPNAGYQGQPNAGYQAQQRVREQQYNRKRRRHPARRSIIACFSVIVILVLLVIGDRVANAVAENDFASQIQSAGLPVRPSVTITGFPFLTQLLAHDLHQVDISASNVPAGPVEISSFKATATGVHINSSFNGGMVDQIHATALVTFAAIASAGGAGGSTLVTISPAGPNKFAISAGGVAIGDAKISITHQDKINVTPVGGSGVVGGILNAVGGASFQGFSFSIPKLPAGLQVKLDSVHVTTQGVVITASAQHAMLSQ